MKRRDFMTISAAVTAGILVLPPGSIIPCSSGRKFKDPMVWFKENYHWIKGWLDTAKPNSYYDDMQIFKTLSRVGASSFIYIDYKKDPNVLRYHAERLEEHKFAILLSCVLGVKPNVKAYQDGSNAYGDLLNGQQLVKTMAGFVDQVGRYPTKKDKVRIEYLQGNEVTRWMQRHEILSTPRGDGGMNVYTSGQFYLFLSECKLKVL